MTVINYVAAWVTFCIVAMGLAAQDIHLVWRQELRFILVPWKLSVFVPAIVFVTFAGPFTNDETWDTCTGGGMSLLAFLTSGWAVGTMYKVIVGQRSKSQMVVALAITLFSSSWFYDAYLLWRDGAYTSRWWSNLVLSPVIYLCAGLLMNLESRGSGVGLACTRSNWPQIEDSGISMGMTLVAIPIVLVATFVLVAFVRWDL